MPIGKLPPRKSQMEASIMDSTIDSRMSSTDVPKMELLKVNYVHQCKSAIMHKSNELPPMPRLNNPARFAGYRRQPPHMAHIKKVTVGVGGGGGGGGVAAALSPNSARKPLPPLPAPTVESWQLLQPPPATGKRTTLPRFLPQQPNDDSDCAQSCCCSHSICSCSDSETTEASTVTPDCEKSFSWNYRGKCSTRDFRRDIARVGIRSRADRIARIESSDCNHRQPQASTPPQSKRSVPQKEINTKSPPAPARLPQTSRIPKPLVMATERHKTLLYNEANAQLQRRVKQLFHQDIEQVEAPRWMFQKAGAAAAEAVPDHNSPRSPHLQPKDKLERVHIRKKRQPLLIVNQLAHAAHQTTTSGTRDVAQGAAVGCSVKNNSYTQCQIPQEDLFKRLSLESYSDSGVSSNGSKELPQSKQTNLHSLDKCVDCVKVLQAQSSSSYASKLTQSPPMQDNQKVHIDPNDVQNFAKKNLTKATTDELLTAAATHPKQCNIENERKLNNLQRATNTTTTMITIDDSWVQESCMDTNDDYIETDSLMMPPTAAERLWDKPVNAHNNNSVKIFVSSGSGGSGNTCSGKRDAALTNTVSVSISCSSTSSACCESSSLDTSSLCESEQDACLCNLGACSASSAPVFSNSCLSSDCCNAVGGVFWNNAYNEAAGNNTTDCCCNISSCDEDNCSYYEGAFDMEHVAYDATDALLLRRHDMQRLRSSHEELLLHNSKLLRKTDVIHELRPRSMDGVVDSGVSLSGDAGSSPDSGEHMQNQQDAEARRLKRGHVLTELLETERIYVHEMSSILKGYCDQMQSEELMHLVPASLQGKEDILFGNLHELYTFHNDVFLKDLENCISTTELVALCFVQRRDTFYRLYSFYCQNIPRSERLRETLVDTHLFLQECQKRLGHKLPLAAYLLKPVQRITKYQLLVKDLLRFSDSGSCTKELQKALDCMLIVLKCVNDSMHQVAITGFPTDLAQQGELLLQDSFQVWTESKKDIRLRIKPAQRHIFLYQKSMLFCKQTSKPGHNKSTYQFKHHVKMSQIGLTESVRGDTKRFEVWLQGRQEVHTLQAPTLDIKNKWVAEIKRVLLNQLEELKGEKIKQYGLNHRGLKQTTSWDTPNIILGTPSRNISCDASSESSNRNSNCSSDDNAAMGAAGGTADKEQQEACGWSSDYSNSEDEISLNEDNSTPGSKFIALADYAAMGHSEVSMREGETIELLKVGCAGWWYVRIIDTNAEGWTPAAYLESINRKSSRSSSRNQERISFK